MCAGAPARAFSEPKIATPQIFYVSKIKNVCGRSPGTFYEPKIAPPPPPPPAFPQPNYNFGEMARAGRESNRVPPPDLQTRSEDHSTRLFSPQNIGSVKISYVSKKENVCVLHAGAFSECFAMGMSLGQ